MRCQESQEVLGRARMRYEEPGEAMGGYGESRGPGEGRGSQQARAWRLGTSCSSAGAWNRAPVPVEAASFETPVLLMAPPHALSPLPLWADRLLFGGMDVKISVF